MFRHRVFEIIVITVAVAACVPMLVAAQVPTTALTLGDFLDDVEGELLDARRVDLRQTESIERINHLRRSRAFELEVDGVYGEQDFDRLEINGGNRKEGKLRQYERTVRFEISTPLLGQSVEDRFIVALETQRILELQVERVLTQRSATLGVVDLYLELWQVQQALTLHARAEPLESERVRILTRRQALGEALTLDVLDAQAKAARRALEQARAERRQSGIFAELAQHIEGTPPAPFRATALDWDGLVARIETQPLAPGPSTALGLPNQDDGDPGLGASFWYNVPKIDLAVAYELHSLDRNFADEVRRERGGIPEVQLSLEMPLDFYRSAKAFRRQVEARHERRRLGVLIMQRRLDAASGDLQLAVREAHAALKLAEVEEALRQEELRVARLRVAAGEIGDSEPPEVSIIRAELETLDAEIALNQARGDLARSLFERELNAGQDPRSLASAFAPGTAPPPHH